MQDDRIKVPPSPTTASGDRGLTRGLRTALGCRHADFLGLSDQERERCREQFAGRREEATDLTEFGVNPTSKAAFDRGSERARVLTTPFLSTMPKQGCKPMLTEREAGVVGKSAPDFTAKVGCGVRF